jgi:hypothetical protein
MLQDFQAGDILIFQLESGYGLMRLLDIDDAGGEPIWHIETYEDLFLDPEAADMALAEPGKLTVGIAHLALTNRAFESTQVARMVNLPPRPADIRIVDDWRASGGEVSDRPVRLMMGFR